LAVVMMVAKLGTLPTACRLIAKFDPLRLLLPPPQLN
jgi:hypothetical protein